MSDKGRELADRCTLCGSTKHGAENCEKPISEVKEPTPDEVLYNLLCDKVGMEWRRDVTITMRADALYWIVFLAQKGIRAKQVEFRADKGMRSIEAAASLGSWTMDLEEFIKRIGEALDKPAKKVVKK